MKRILLIVALTLLATAAMAQPYRAGFGVTIDRDSLYRPTWSLRMAHVDSLIARRADSIARQRLTDSLRSLANGVTWRLLPSAIRPTGTLGQVLKMLPGGTVGFGPDSAGSAGATGRVYLDSYSGGTANDGYGRIDSSGALYLIQFPNFDSESFGGAANFANVGTDNDSSRFPLNGAQVLYQWTYPVYLDRVELIVQWGSGAGKASYSITGLPPLGVDSGLVAHFRTQGGGAVKDRWIRLYRRAVARGYSFVLNDPHLVFLTEIQVSTLTGGTWPSAGTSVQMLIRLRARRKHL